MRFRRSHHYIKRNTDSIVPEDVLLDSSNLPSFDRQQFEGRLEKPVTPLTCTLTIVAFIIISSLFATKLWNLQVVEGYEYLTTSERNRLTSSVIFPKRGVIVDRRGVELAWNTDYASHSVASSSHTTTSTISLTAPVVSDDREFPRREYRNAPGLAHVLGYVSYPKKDSSGFYFQDEIVGVAGVELHYDALLAGDNGRRIHETNALGNTVSESVVDAPHDGETLNLAIDARLQSALHTTIKDVAGEVNFEGGGGVVMDVRTGEIIALTSFPEYSPQVFTEGDDDATIAATLASSTNPFLNRVTDGLYTPGSIVKPFVGLAALTEGVVTPNTSIYSGGSISIPNIYNPDNPTIFNDWKAHGWVDLMDALAVSSNIYFFEVSGGFEDQVGIGIDTLVEYMDLFDIAEPSGIDLPTESGGVVPHPDWKETVFPGDPWRIGDTYNTSIGQYGFQVTPVQMVRATAALANGGTLLTPRIRTDGGTPQGTPLAIEDAALHAVQEGMRQAVTDGIGASLNVPYTNLAVKTGTAEVGTAKVFVNSWVVGFWPYENPRYAFATVMERGPADNLFGASPTMRRWFDWLSENAPEYL